MSKEMRNVMEVTAGQLATALQERVDALEAQAAGHQKEAQGRTDAEGRRASLRAAYAQGQADSVGHFLAWVKELDPKAVVIFPHNLTGGREGQAESAEAPTVG